MCWRSSYIIVALALTLFACKGKESESPTAKTPVEAIDGYFNPHALAEPSELLAMAETPHIKVVDFREQDAYEKGHIPGSIRLWRTDIEDAAQPVPGMIAPREKMETLFSNLGINNTDTLILYDAHGGVDAARLWWVLQVYGFNKVRLLNGGLQAWEKLHVPPSREEVAYLPSTFRFEGEGASNLRIENDRLQSLLGETGWTLVDARTTDEFSGKRMKKGAHAAGRIPGSIHIDWADAVHYNGDKTFKPARELKKIYKQLPDDGDSPIVIYCHSGVRSAHTTFVLTQLLGYRQVHNYDGSWLEWSSLEGVPIEKDSTTSILK